MANGKFWADFKAFAMKGNVIDMAVGVVVGGAFGKIVTSLVNDIIMPLVGTLLGGFDFTQLKIALPSWGNADPDTAATLNYGNFIQQTVDFLIIAMCIFVVLRMMMKATSRLSGKKEEEEAATPAPAPEKPEDVKLLEEIRDLLSKR